MPRTKSETKKGASKRGKAKAAKTRGARAAARKKHRFTAKTADRYELYQLAVQSPEEDVQFLRETYEELRGRTPHHLREDFCGTALLSATWAKQGGEFTAEGYDLDPEPLEWGRARNLAPLGEDAERVQLFLDDARAPGRRPVDVRVAQNFSYWIFTTRQEMLEYFRIARDSLAEDGIFVIDLYGGTEANEHTQEIRKIEAGFTYVWDQKEYWPGTGEFVCSIHFRFRDGSRMDNAFTYRWRFWHLTELRDILYDAGFRHVQPYFEGTDANGVDGDGIFRPDDRGENCASWIGYLVSQK